MHQALTAHAEISTVLMWMVIMNALVICFLIALGVEYVRPDGLGNTLYTLKDDFLVAKNTMQSVRRRVPGYG